MDPSYTDKALPKDVKILRALRQKARYVFPAVERNAVTYNIDLIFFTMLEFGYINNNDHFCGNMNHLQNGCPYGCPRKLFCMPYL